MKSITVQKISKLLMASLIGLFGLSTAFAGNFDVPVTVVNNTDQQVRIRCEEESLAGKQQSVVLYVDAKQKDTKNLSVDGAFLSLILCSINGKTIRSPAGSFAAGYPYFSGTKLKLEVSKDGVSGPADILSILVKLNEAAYHNVKI